MSGERGVSRVRRRPELPASVQATTPPGPAARRKPAVRQRAHALTASAVGGISNPLAAVVGGVAVGLIESVVAARMGSLWQLAVGIGMLMLVLTLRPEGLLTRRKARSV